MRYKRHSIDWRLVFLASVWLSFAGCKTVIHRATQETAPETTAAPSVPNLTGLWVMGNASSGTEASTIIRIEQQGHNIRGIIDRPSKDYAKQFGVKKGDLEFEGVIEQRIIRGKVNSYLALELKSECPRLPAVTLKDFEIALSEDGNSLNGWTVKNWIDEENCEQHMEGRSPYTFKLSTDAQLRLR